MVDLLAPRVRTLTRCFRLASPTTVSPCCTRSRATAAPIPELAPVTSATRPIQRSMLLCCRAHTPAPASGLGYARHFTQLPAKPISSRGLGGTRTRNNQPFTCNLSLIDGLGSIEQNRNDLVQAKITWQTVSVWYKSSENKCYSVIQY